MATLDPTDPTTGTSEAADVLEATGCKRRAGTFAGARIADLILGRPVVTGLAR